MVKKLYLVRHAEASNSTASDFQRPLTAVGERVARHLGKWIDQQEFAIDQIISSTALRAKSTAELIDESLRKENIKHEEELYEASVRTFLRVVNAIASENQQVLMVAHNPTITYLVEYLTGSAIVGMEPGSMCILTFSDVEWSEVGEKTLRMDRYISPTEIS